MQKCLNLASLWQFVISTSDPIHSFDMNAICQGRTQANKKELVYRL